MKISFFLVITVIFFSCHSKKQPPIKTGLEGKPMPSIALTALDSTHFDTKNIQTGKPTILFAFSPGCPYCRAQTRSIVSNINTLKEINIYMLCITQFPLLNKFYNQFELNKYSNIKIGIDYNFSFINYYKSENVPYLAIYDKEKDLKQVLIGKKPISTLKEIALE